MHMSDALISPAVGLAMWGVTASVASYSLKKLNIETDEKKLPLMGVLGAFVFAAQMINFAIPGTGSSGHLGGGLLLAALLGPHAAFLTLTVVLFIQALFFADGGLLAFGCNVFNLGFYTCFIAYPLYKRLIRRTNIWFASIIAAVVGLQLGAFSVVVQTLLSGKVELPFTTFTLFMQPIHLAIGIVEGMATAAVISFVIKAKPELLTTTDTPMNRLIGTLGLLALTIGGIFSSIASSKPDGLEWSIFHTAGTDELHVTTTLHTMLERLQQSLSLLPDYNLKSGNVSIGWLDLGTSISGIFGTFIVAIAIMAPYIIKKWRKEA
ncbi:cobalamin biosynthesis protein CbiM [Anoxybacillus flavithermus]|uniref:Cobalamin biosynthesis protein CbiM n=1 Tax=Anoxybacillus flavithermus TaxID=33934 RepID=A0A2G5RS27_9BACL|nr:MULTISPECIES: energy-coupling factor ABC transporter permease [Anoxybacillus]KFZ42666.1 cobalamin biosynthesis protein CbiM [Anoxybacillus sp. KU2-6(11)]PIC05471.1 cobalamin biosynthesis protein CbiM [Anoxybacillus flavithermus]